MSDTRKISITEALNELKLYDSKITKAVTNGLYVGAAKKSADNIGVLTKSDYTEKANAGYQSVTALITNRNKLISAVVQSNAVTNVEIAGVQMTRAEAIERKTSINYEKALLGEMKRQYATATAAVITENRKVDAQIDKMLETYMGRDTDKKIFSEDQAAITDPYRNKNEFELVDPLSIYEKILELETSIDDFESNIDTSLCLSNATTFIEI